MATQQAFPIDRLPPELRLQVLSHLPPSSQVLFALTCKRHKILVGEEPFALLRRPLRPIEKVERDRLLLLLPKAYEEEQGACGKCSKIHTVNSQRWCWSHGGYYDLRIQGEREKRYSKIYLQHLRFLVHSVPSGTYSMAMLWFNNNYPNGSETNKVDVTSQLKAHVKNVPRNIIYWEIVNKRFLVRQEIRQMLNINLMARLLNDEYPANHLATAIVGYGCCNHNCLNYIKAFREVISSFKKFEEQKSVQQMSIQQPMPSIHATSELLRCPSCPREVVFTAHIHEDRKRFDACRVSMVTFTDLGSGELGDRTWGLLRDDEYAKTPRTALRLAGIPSMAGCVPDKSNLGISAAFQGSYPSWWPQGQYTDIKCLE